MIFFNFGPGATIGLSPAEPPTYPIHSHLTSKTPRAPLSLSVFSRTRRSAKLYIIYGIFKFIRYYNTVNCTAMM